MKKYLLPCLLLVCFACKQINPPKAKAQEKMTKEGLPLDRVQLPPGFKIEIFADNLKNARSIVRSPEGTIYVGTRNEGNVYAIRDEDGDFKAEQKYTLAKDLNMPNGVAVRNGQLFVAEVNRILRFDNIESHLASPPEPVVVYDKYPTSRHHGWKYIAFGPDDKLYVPVGAPCNICESKDRIYNSITRINPDGTGMEIIQEGIRNTVGFTWHPQTKELWFTDNGRDWMGDDVPACELNHAPKDGMHFGYPYCHQGDLPDPDFGKNRSCEEFTAPVQKLGPHTAPLGLAFYTGKQFPAAYRNQIIVAEHGSWNREKKIGYRLMLIKMEGDKAISYEPFAEGWLDESKDEAWGRPVDLAFLPDGSMLVSDDFADVIYRISYQG